MFRAVALSGPVPSEGAAVAVVDAVSVKGVTADAFAPVAGEATTASALGLCLRRLYGWEDCSCDPKLEKPIDWARAAVVSSCS